MTLPPEQEALGDIMSVRLASGQAKVDMPAFVAFAFLGSGSQQLPLCQQEIFGIMLEEGGAATIPRYALNRGFHNF